MSFCIFRPCMQLVQFQITDGKALRGAIAYEMCIMETLYANNTLRTAVAWQAGSDAADIKAEPWAEDAPVAVGSSGVCPLLGCAACTQQFISARSLAHRLLACRNSCKSSVQHSPPGALADSSAIAYTVLWRRVTKFGQMPPCRGSDSVRARPWLTARRCTLASAVLGAARGRAGCRSCYSIRFI